MRSYRWMKKATVYLLMATIIALSCCLVSCADKAPKLVLTFDVADSTYALYDDDQLYLASYNGAEKGTQVIRVTVPSFIAYEGKEYKVAGVQGLAFDHAKVSQIVLSEGITKIDNYAFAYCGATIIDLPSTIESIGEYAFVNTMSLRRLNLLAAVPPKVGTNAFKYYDSSLKEYCVSDILTIKVPAASYDSYFTEWREYVDALSAQ